MSKFVLHPEAYADLNESWEYVAADNIDAADRLLDEIYSAIGTLTRFPHTGHVRPDLTSHAMRFQLVRDYVIAYVPDEELLTVIAILHGRRNPRVLAAILNRRS
jgi:plasmid stabilization system protein ParE